MLTRILRHSLAKARSYPELSFAGFAGEKTDYVQVDNLITIDPVNAGPSDSPIFDGSRPANIANWINVEGTPTEGNHNVSDRIEGAGESVSGSFDTSGTDSQVSTKDNHNNFTNMFNAAGGSRKFDNSYTVTGSRIRRY